MRLFRKLRNYFCDVIATLGFNDFTRKTKTWPPGSDPYTMNVLTVLLKQPNLKFVAANEREKIEGKASMRRIELILFLRKNRIMLTAPGLITDVFLIHTLHLH